MTDRISFDFGEMNTLLADVSEAPAEVISNLRKAVEVTAHNIDEDWEKYAGASNRGGHARRYPSSITYDMILDQNGIIAAEIGPDLGRSQGSLGILEDAAGGVRAAPQRNRDKALRDNLADFERGILKATEARGL